MAADLILTLTNTGDELELDSLIEGAAIPKLMNFVIGMGDAVTEEADIKALTEVPDAFATKLPLGAVERLPNGGGAKLFGHFTLDLRLPEGKKITGIGVELADGSLYGYTPYYPLSGGVDVPLGMAFTFYVILAKLNAKVLTVQYEPYDSDAMADIVIDKANLNFQNLPFYPIVETDDNKLSITDNLDGTITVDPNQTFLMRGINRFSTSGYNVEQRTFTIEDGHVYHLRFDQVDDFRLLDLVGDYNPDAKAADDIAFASTYDDMLVATIMNISGTVAIEWNTNSGISQNINENESDNWISLAEYGAFNLLGSDGGNLEDGYHEIQFHNVAPMAAKSSLWWNAFDTDGQVIPDVNHTSGRDSNRRSLTTIATNAVHNGENSVGLSGILYIDKTGNHLVLKAEWSMAYNYPDGTYSEREVWTFHVSSTCDSDKEVGKIMFSFPFSNDFTPQSFVRIKHNA